MPCAFKKQVATGIVVSSHLFLWLKIVAKLLKTAE